MIKLLGFGSTFAGIVLLMIAWSTPVAFATAPLLGGAVFTLGGIFLMRGK